MTMTMLFPRIQPQQAASIYAQQTTSQQTSGVDISSIMAQLLPVMIIGMMMTGMAGMMSQPKRIKVAMTESTNPQIAKAATAGHAEPAS